MASFEFLSIYANARYLGQDALALSTWLGPSRFVLKLPQPAPVWTCSSVGGATVI